MQTVEEILRIASRRACVDSYVSGGIDSVQGPKSYTPAEVDEMSSILEIQKPVIHILDRFLIEFQLDLNLSESFSINE